MRRSQIVALAAVAALAGAPASAKTLVFCSELSLENLSPMLATTSTSDTAAARAVYGKLFEFALGTTNLEPALAESYEISDDGKSARTKLYEEAQILFKEEAPWITMAHSIVYVPMRKGVTGYKVDPLGA